jgi:hypothetical protein
MNEQELQLSQLASEISQRICQLEELVGEDLKNEMAALKAAILENPAASALLQDSDIGKLVSALRKITGTAIATASAAKAKTPKEPKTAAKKMTAAEIAAALDSDDF